MVKLIKGGTVYAPDHRGVCDVLIMNGTVVSVDKDILWGATRFPCEVYDARGMYVLPGIVDPHLHLIGGGGASGFNSRAGEIAVEEILASGVTTVVGCLGFDRVSKDLKTLLVKTLALVQHGISAYMMIGSFNLPSLTLLGSIEEDLSLIEKVIGVKLALGENLGNCPDAIQIKNLLAECLRGAKLGGKAGFLQIHLGAEGLGWPRQMITLCKEMGLSPSRAIFTHCNRNRDTLEEAVEYAKAGGRIDLTASFSDREKAGSLTVGEALERLVAHGVALAAVSVSSDGNATRTTPDGTLKYIPIRNLFDTFTELLKSDLHAKEDTVGLYTKNNAAAMGLGATKGSLEPGKDADVLILDQDFGLVSVLARGRWAVKDGTPHIQELAMRGSK